MDKGTHEVEHAPSHIPGPPEEIDSIVFRDSYCFVVSCESGELRFILAWINADTREFCCNDISVHVAGHWWPLAEAVTTEDVMDALADFDARLWAAYERHVETLAP